MRKIATFIALTFTTLSLAQVPDLGAKPDMVVKTPEQPTPLVGAWDMVQMLVALVIVFVLLKWALPKIVSKIQKKGITSSDSSILVEESANFGGGNLQIISARGKTLLLCVSQTGVTCLADLTKEEATKEIEEPAFFELVDEASKKDEESLRAVVEITEPAPAEATDEAQAVLARLERLTG